LAGLRERGAACEHQTGGRDGEQMTIAHGSIPSLVHENRASTMMRDRASGKWDGRAEVRLRPMVGA
jgi:hypothetical protein